MFNNNNIFGGGGYGVDDGRMRTDDPILDFLWILYYYKHNI